MSSLLDRLDKLKTARAELALQLKVIEAESKDVQTEYNLLHNESLPVSVLPYDVLAMIFEAAIYKVECFEITISHVSQRWRDIALRTPLLWAMIRHVCHLRRGRVSTYLERSKAVPIHLFVEIYSENVSHMCDLISIQIRRCRELCIIISDSDKNAARILERLSLQHAPLLKHFRLYFQMDSDGSSSSLVPQQFFAGVAPSLTSMSLDRISLSMYRLPPTPLTALHLDCCNLSSDNDARRLRDMIVTSTSLKQLKLNFLYAWPRWPSEVIIPLPDLHALLIRGNKNQISGLLAALHAPSLQMLHLTRPHSLIHPFGDSLTLNWSTKKFPALHTLHSNNLFHAGVHRVRRIAREFPSVVNVTCPHTPPGLFAALEETQDPIWPHLQTIQLPFPSRDTNTMVAEISQLLNKRIGMGYPIKKVMVQQSLTEEDWQGLRRLAEIEIYVADDWPNPFSGC